MKVEYFKVNETNKKEIVEIVANLDGKKQLSKVLMSMRGKNLLLMFTHEQKFQV